MQHNINLLSVIHSVKRDAEMRIKKLFMALFGALSLIFEKKAGFSRCPVCAGGL